MDIYVPCVLLIVFVAVDWAITHSSRRRNEWGFWENWNFFVYGPCFIILCAVIEVEVWRQGWSAGSRLPILIGFPVVAIFLAQGWYSYVRKRLRALFRGNRDADGSGDDEKAELPG